MKADVHVAEKALIVLLYSLMSENILKSNESGRIFC